MHDNILICKISNTTHTHTHTHTRRRRTCLLVRTTDDRGPLKGMEMAKCAVGGGSGKGSGSASGIQFKILQSNRAESARTTERHTDSSSCFSLSFFSFPLPLGGVHPSASSTRSTHPHNSQHTPTHAHVKGGQKGPQH